MEAVQGNTVTEAPDPSVYYVYNAADWMGFVEQANAGTFSADINTVRLMRDVDLAGVEYGAYALTIPEESTFTIDGNNHKIINLNTSASRNPGTGDSWYATGLLAKVAGEWRTNAHGSKLVVKNLTVDNATVTTEHSDWDSAAAVLVGETYALNEIEFNNCSVVNSSVTSGAYAAAFIGYDYSFILNNQKIIVVGGSVKNSTFIGNDATAALIAINYTPATISGVEISGNTVKGGNGYSAAAVIGTANATFTATNVTLANNTFAMNEGNNNYLGNHQDIGYFYNGDGVSYVVNRVPYVTSLEQFSAAVNGTYSKVVLAADITNETLPMQGATPSYTYKLTRNLSIDLAGHTFTTAHRLFKLSNNASLSLESSSENGKIYINKSSGNEVYGFVVDGGCLLNIKENVTIDMELSNRAATQTIILNNGTVNMEGGRLIGRNTVVIASVMSAEGIFNMTGGEINIDAQSTGIQQMYSGTVSLTKGSITGNGTAYQNRGSIFEISDDFVIENQ